MSAAKQATRPAWKCIQCTIQASNRPPSLIRTFIASAVTAEEAQLQQPESSTPPPLPSSRALDPNLVYTRRDERRLIKTTGKEPVGSRRRRAALATLSPQLPFTQLPYQAFQEALKVLRTDRAEKLQQIETQRARIVRLEAQDAAVSGGEREKQHRLKSMRKYLEELKILADINDPVVKKRFEDGEGDLSKPVYRHLALKQWHQLKRPTLIQRITQMHVVPDILPSLDPTADISITFSRHLIQPGSFVPSALSETPPSLRIQVFDAGARLVSIAVVDADVPAPERDGFGYRCHFLAANVPVSPTAPGVSLRRLGPSDQVILPWLPPFAQKGSPYHRLAVFVMEQPAGAALDVAAAKAEGVERDGFKLRGWVDRHGVKPVGASLFRCVWDEGTRGVMERAGVPGADVEYKRKRIEPLPEKYRRKDGARYR